PFVVASATAPLLQSWYARSRADRGSDPYFLYAASNVGSLLDLISYPLLIEPGFGLAAQGRLWSFVFGLLASGTLACGLMASGGFRARETEREGIYGANISWRQRLSGPTIMRTWPGQSSGAGRTRSEPASRASLHVCARVCGIMIPLTRLTLMWVSRDRSGGIGQLDRGGIPQ